MPKARVLRISLVAYTLVWLIVQITTRIAS